VTSALVGRLFPHVLGEYEIQISATDSRGDVIKISPFKMTLIPSELIILAVPKSNLNRADIELY